MTRIEGKKDIAYFEKLTAWKTLVGSQGSSMYECMRGCAHIPVHIGSYPFNHIRYAFEVGFLNFLNSWHDDIIL